MEALSVPANARLPQRAVHIHLERGVAAVETAIVMSLFVTLLMGVIEMGRLLWTWNAASEATRMGARTAVVCNVGETSVSAWMRQRLPYLQPGNVSVDYLPTGCSDANCQSVRVTVTGYVHEPIIPFLNLSVTLPPFQTTLPREFMQSAGNSVCQAPT